MTELHPDAVRIVAIVVALIALAFVIAWLDR